MSSIMNYKKIEILNELNNLSESITNYFAGQIQEFLGLTDFIEQMSSELRDFSSKVKLPKNYKPESPDNLDINPFYEVNSIFLSSMQVIPDKIDKEVLSLLKAFKEEFESDNKNVFFSLNSIIEEISSEQEVMKKIKSELDEEKKKNENFQNSQKYEDYVKEKQNLIKIYSNSEKKFKDMKAKFEENETKKMKIISNCIYCYLNIMHEDLKFIDNKNGDIKKLLKKYKKPDKKSIKDIFPNSNILNITNWSGYEDWDIELDQLQSIIIDKDKDKEMESKGESKGESKDQLRYSYTSVGEFYIPQIVVNNNMIGIDDEYMILKSAQNQTSFVDIIEDENKIKDNIVINNFLFGLELIELNNDLMLNLEDIFGRNIGNKNFYLDFCNKLIKARGESKTLYQFKIFSNLEYLKNLLNLIIDDIKTDLFSEKATEGYYEAYKILDEIIVIGEKCVNEDTYMCSLLSSNKIFKDKKIWINCIKNKIINLLNDICLKEYSSKSQESIFKPEEFIKRKIIGKIGGLLHGKGKKNLIEACGFNKILDYYNKLTNEQKKTLGSNSLSIYHGVIKCYIRHITNYNYNLNVKDSTDIISEICSNLKIDDNEYIVFYFYYYQDCSLTSKKKDGKIKSNISLKTKYQINLIKSEKNNNKIISKNLFDITNDANKFFIIKKVCKFLPDNDKLKLISLGKYYQNIKKYIYKSFLKKDISIEKRLNIWKSYLKYNMSKNLFNYKEILKETETDFFKQANKNSIIQIEKDIKRTYLRKKVEDTPQKLYNILVSFVYSENKINYVQGINNITGFIFDLTENEEDTYHMLISLFTMTQLCDIYNDEEFQNLKTFFYVAERLVYLYLPKIYSRLKDNNIQMSFFLSAYFITLNTILYPSLPKDDISFLLHIWDDFILDGWCSFFTIWLAILKYNENQILTVPDDRVFNFLTNEIKDSDIFKKENYQKVSKLKKTFKVKEILINNLRDEIAVEAGIRKVGASTIIEDFNDDDKLVQTK